MTLNLPEKAQSGKGSGPACVIGELCGILPQASGKLPDTHSVGSFCDNNLGVFIVAKIAMENTDAVPPAHPVPRTPEAACPGLQRCRAPRVPLTRLARLTAWQSLGTGHVDASLEKRLLPRVLLSSCQNRFSKLLNRVGLGKKNGILNKQRCHAICLAVTGRVDHAQAAAKLDSFPGQF